MEVNILICICEEVQISFLLPVPGIVLIDTGVEI